ncbi:MAG TPA: NAD(P)-dependent oxidoreductase [Actinomycetota bacterium]|nr:NAD(P)-dependent oxidoreductase [Actinomycetota bacterium]
MRIFVAGASGVIGRRLLPELVENGHYVVGLARSERSARLVRSLGAEPVTADALDARAVRDAVRRAEPEVVVHQLTALTGVSDPRKFEREFEPTNRLRTIGTDYLLAAAREAGARRFVAQSFAPTIYAREDGPVKTEEDPLDPNPPKPLRTTFDALVHLERAVLGATDLEGVVLRYGGFYGPGTSLGEPDDDGRGGEYLDAIRRGRFPLVGSGDGVWSFVHADDAASATAAAIQRGEPGVYNVMDDDPAPVFEWLPALADAIGARSPRRVPVWAARLLAGEAAVVMMTGLRGSSNAKAKPELGWTPRWPSWREGFVHGLGSPARSAAGGREA